METWLALAGFGAILGLLVMAAISRTARFTGQTVEVLEVTKATLESLLVEQREQTAVLKQLLRDSQRGAA